MTRKAQAVAGHARPAMSRELLELRNMLFGELVNAVKRLVHIALEKLGVIRKMFGYHMSDGRAKRKVFEHYSREEHPRDDQRVPARLLEAFSALGLVEFVRVKRLGDAMRNSDRIPLSDEQKRSAIQIFSSTSADGPPNASWRHQRSSKMRSPHDWAAMPGMA